MKIRAAKCKYCQTDFTEGTTRKTFCSSRCRVYWHRENPKESRLEEKNDMTERKEPAKIETKTHNVEQSDMNKLDELLAEIRKANQKP